MSEYISKYTGAEIDDRLEWAEGITPHVADKANPHEVTKSQVGLGNADNTSDALKPLSTAATVALAGKVDKVAGKGLSANDYTNQDRDKLAGIDVGAEVNPDIADDLETDDATKVLSAKQGKVLADIVSTNVVDLGNLTNLVDANIADIADLVKGKNAALNLPASWEQGTLATPPTGHSASNSRIRTGYIEISPSETYTISVGEGYMCWCPEYDTDYAVTARGVASSNVFNALTFTSTATTKYVRIVVYKKGVAYDSTNPDDYIIPDDIVNVDIKLRGKGWIFTNEELADIVDTISPYVGDGTVVKDVTFNNDWKSGTPSIDTSTGVITLEGHGFVNTDAVEFGAGTGVLPTGILSYDSVAGWNTYYNVINATTDTFQITDVISGTTPVIPSDAGTAGWQVRSGQLEATQLAGLNIANDKAYEITCILPFVRRGSTSITEIFLRPLDGNYYYLTKGHVGQRVPRYQNISLCSEVSSLANTDKRVLCIAKIKVTPVGTKMFYDISSSLTITGADTKTTKELTFSNVAVTVEDVSKFTALLTSTSWVAAYLSGNGTRIIVRKVSI